MRDNYLIKSKFKGLYWNNNIGWVNIEMATRFSKEETEKFLYLPVETIGWKKLSKKANK